MSIKNNIKKMLEKYPKLNVDKLKKEIDKYDYISFDIFDTLIKRDVPNPNDVFKIISIKNKLPLFFEDRIKAEHIARLNCKSEEICLEDIYNLLKNKYDIEKLKKDEIATEINLCTKRNDIYEIYKYCVKNKKTIVLTSNMYLPQKNILEILMKNNYKHFKKVYISCEIGKKKNGTLFGYILKELKIKPNEILHIGDSYKRDYKSAKNNGINAFLIPKNNNQLTHNELKAVNQKDEFFVKSLDCFINNRINLANDKYYNFGYQSFGILLYGFNKHMHDELKKKGINNIYFFSRDGYVIKKAYDEMYPNDEIKSHYIYVSRRSLRVPQIWVNPKLEDVYKTLPLAKLLTMETFIKNLGLDPHKYRSTLRKYNFSLNSNIEKKEILTNNFINSFYDEIKQDVIDNSKKECQLLMNYFKQEGLKGKVAVVDIGWHGSLQYFIQNLAHETNYDLEMEGYYIGLAKEAKKEIISKGYVVDINSTTNSCDSWKAFNGLAETIFLAQEGSTKKFKNDNGKIKPVLYPYEYSDKNGNKEIEAKKVKSLQAGAISFIHDFKYSYLEELDYSSFTAYRKIYLTGLYPKKEDIEMFGDFRFLEEQIDYLAKPQKIRKYILKPKQLKKDLMLSRWKIGFLKKLLVVDLPYTSIYKILRKISEK